MRAWLNDNYIVLAILAIMLVGTVIIAMTPPVVIAAPPPDVPPCEAINTADSITVFYCEPDYGAPYKINSLGFMLNEE